MECVEAKAFRTSLWRPEMLVKSSSSHHDEEVSKFCLWGSSNNNGCTPTNGDETFVDDLLDFSNEETGGVIVKEEEEYEETVISNTEMKTVFSPEKNSASLKNDFASVFASELSVPSDDLADLEWLSHFVEDSFSEEFSQTQYNDGNTTVLAEPKTENQDKTEPEKKPEFMKTESIETVSYEFSQQPPPPPTTTTTATTVPGKARSKRSRTGGRVWSLGYSSLTETSSSSSTTTTTTSSTTSSSSSCLIFNSTIRTPDYFDSLGKPPVIRHKKQRFLNEDDNGGGGGARVIRTQCSHCGVQKTPQWRTGPLGAKTLCNACGVRYKSGRLLPEYRPASSPTFSKAVHSNSHRKVLEMRKKKEVVAPESGFTSAAVHSF
ncbi:hypothetical protein MKX01_033172 [Papaver californicum]|nr:hypothetical protein MKX01_033172 [Papaver californicum]